MDAASHKGRWVPFLLFFGVGKGGGSGGEGECDKNAASLVDSSS